MGSLTKAFEIVEHAGHGDSSLKNGAFLKSHLEFSELVIVLFNLAVNIRHETAFEGPFP